LIEFFYPQERAVINYLNLSNEDTPCAKTNKDLVAFLEYLFFAGVEKTKPVAGPVFRLAREEAVINYCRIIE
jgi:hypothetical protein